MAFAGLDQFYLFKLNYFYVLPNFSCFIEIYRLSSQDFFSLSCFNHISINPYHRPVFT